MSNSTGRANQQGHGVRSGLATILLEGQHETDLEKEHRGSKLLELSTRARRGIRASEPTLRTGLMV